LKRDIGLAVLGAGALAGFMVPLARHLRFDYDEWLAFHAVWQVSAGHKPYVDFYFAREPYEWVMYAPVLKLLPQRAGSLVLLRLLNLKTSFLALALFLFCALRLRPDRSWKTCALAAVGRVVLQVPVIFTFAQFRSDHLVLALAFIGLGSLEGAGPALGRTARWVAAGFCFMAGLLLTPKLVVIYAAAALVYGCAEEKRRLHHLFAFALGAAAAFIAVNAGTAAAGVDPRPYLGILQRHWTATARAGYRFGLARMVLLRAAYNPLWVVVFAAGLYGAGAELREKGWKQNKLLLVLLAFALIQPFWVKYFYDQYLYTVLLAWSLPLALFLHRVGQWKSQAAQAAVALLFIGGVCNALPEFVNYEHDRRGLEDDVAAIDRLLPLAPEGEAVAMQPPRHVVFRENSTFFFDHSITPGGPVTEDLMRSTRYAEKFTYEGFLAQLERRQPSLIFVNPAFAGKDYLRAIEAYERAHAREYARVESAAPELVLVRTTRP